MPILLTHSYETRQGSLSSSRIINPSSLFVKDSSFVVSSLSFIFLLLLRFSKKFSSSSECPVDMISSLAQLVEL